MATIRQITLLVGLLLLSQMHSSAKQIDNLEGGDMHFHGTVIASSCSVVPGDERIPVNFNAISVAEIYKTGRSQLVPFSIRLENCHNRVFSNVIVTFNGIENSKLPDHVAVDAGSPAAANGIGVGFLDSDRSQVRLNQPMRPLAIVADNKSLDFFAFVAGEPAAIAAKRIKPGPFNATINYVINYQ